MTDKPPKTNPVFKNKDQIEYYYKVVLPQLAEYSHTSKAEWVELFTEHCLAEGKFDSALTDFLTYIQQEGLDIEMEPRELGKDMDKLFRLRFLRKAINAAGLGFLEADILREEVVKLYRGNKGEPGINRTRRKDE